MSKRTKIVATIGPASERFTILEQMVKAGVNVTRLNFSHGSYKSHEALIRNIRRVEKKLGAPVGIMQDLQGPKIRIGLLPADGILIKTGQKIIVNTAKKKYSEGELPFDYPGLHKFLKPGERILVDDGRAELKVIKKKGSKIYCHVVEGRSLSSHKGINLPDTKLPIPVLSEKDKKDLFFGLKMKVDIVALSFVSSAQDIKDLRALIVKYEKKLGLKEKQPIFVVAKIERHEALKNIKTIIAEADGIMVARGDLAMETKMAEMPLTQKTIVEKANKMVKPVIVATQMLDSMQQNRRPTRAEITDVANAVIDHADALMLSNETAVGKYPVETVKTMSKIIKATEESKYDNVDPRQEVHQHISTSKAIAGLSGLLAKEIGAKATLVASATGRTGRLVSQIRSELPVFVGVETERAGRQLCLSWGVSPFLLPRRRSIEELIKVFLTYVKKQRMVKKGDKVVVVTGEPVGKPGSTNLLEVREIK